MTHAEDCPAIVVCVEPGLLEYKALCLILSLRENWGRWANVPIYAYSPRPGRCVSRWLLHAYDKYEVTPIVEALNTDYADYPLANKPICMADAEGRLGHSTLIFLDSDIICWHEPLLFDLPEGKDLALVVDGTKSVASNGPGDKYEEMWQSLYKLAQVTSEPYVKTLLTDELVRGWWGSGVIVARRQAGVMAQWLSVFKAALQQVNFLPAAMYLREQMTLCAVVAATYDRFVELPVGYNYPVQNHKHYRSRGVPPEAAVLWHYQPFLNKAFRKFSVRLDSVATLAGKCAEAHLFIADLEKNYPRRIGRDESMLRRIRRRLELGPRLRRLLGAER